MSHIYISKDVVNPNHVTIDNAYTLFQYTITKTQSFDYSMKTHITKENSHIGRHVAVNVPNLQFEKIYAF